MTALSMFFICISFVFAFLSFFPQWIPEEPEWLREAGRVIANIYFATFIFLVGFLTLFIFA